MVFINKGDDQGIYFFQLSTIDRNMALNLSAGIAAGNIDLNEKSGQSLTRATFEGNRKVLLWEQVLLVPHLSIHIQMENGTK